MVVKWKKQARPSQDGSVRVICYIQSDTMPGPMPKTGAEVKGLDPDAVIDTCSELHVLADGGSNWVMGEDGEWYEIGG